METTVITYNAASAVARGGSYEYPTPSSRSVATTSGAHTEHKRVKINLPKTTSRQSKKRG